MSEEEILKERELLRKRLKDLSASPRSDWHREFEDALQLDVESWDNGSWLIREHTLGEDAPRIDFIVVSGENLPDDVKDIFKLFRKKNVIEFKGPGDKLTHLTIFKVAAYVYFYVATAKSKENVSIDEVTASIFFSEEEKGLLAKLQKEGIVEKTDADGVYIVKGIVNVPFQIINVNELKGKENAAYRVLKAHADETDVDYLLDALKKADDQNSKERLHRILGLVEVKNPGSVAKKIQGDKVMRDVFMDILKPQIDEHDRINLYGFVQNGTMTVDNAAKNAGITVEQFRKQMEEYNRTQNLQTV